MLKGAQGDDCSGEAGYLKARRAFAISGNMFEIMP